MIQLSYSEVSCVKGTVHVSVTCNSQEASMESNHVPICRSMDKENPVCIHNGIEISLAKDRTFVICDSIGELGKHYA